MSKLLIVVDMQNDFIDGSLANKDAEAIVNPMSEYIWAFDGDICFTYDTHKRDYLNTTEGKYLPIEHCIDGTNGWYVPGRLIKASYGKNTFNIEKPTFGYKDWDKEHLDGYDEITMIGTCTDICVVSNALIIKSQYPNIPIKVVSNLCAGLTPERHEAALEVMRSCQIEVL